MEPLQVDNVGTAVLQLAEGLLEGGPLVPLVAYRHRIPVVVIEEHWADDALCAQSIPHRQPSASTVDVHGGCLREGIGSISSGSVCSRHHAGKHEIRPTTRF